MKKRKTPVHLIIMAVHFSAALVTLIPYSGASRISRLGYKALCSFSPYGTAILVALGIMHIVLHITSRNRKAP